MHFRPEIASVPESPLVAVATAAEGMVGAIKLCYGESDLPTPEFICTAAHEAAIGGHTFYTHTAGYLELRETIAAKVHALHGVTYRPTEVMSTVGASMAIYLAIRACVGAGDNAVIVTPGYGIFANVVRMCGGEVRAVPLVRSGGGFVLDVDRVRRAIDTRTRMVIVNSPSNPTGWVASVEEQEALCELATAHDVMLLADEVYDRLAFDVPVAPSIACVARDREHLVVVNSFSKTFNMTGWRLGWAQASERMIRVMTSAAEFMTSNPTAAVQQAGIVALRDGDAYVHDLRRHYAERRAQVMRELPKIPGVSLVEPRGAFYAFMQIDGLTDSAAFTMDLLRESGIALAPGSAFGDAGEGYVRMCFAATEDTLTRALDRFRGFMLKAQHV
jgi:aspartate/methionine/tyrosine aminotransferase